MIFRLFLLLALAAGSQTTLTAQTKVQLSLPQAIGLGGTEMMCVPVVADSFPSIISASFSIGWDTTEVEFAEVRLGGNPLELNDMSIRTDDPDNFGIATIASDLMAYAVSPGDTLFELCFLGKNEAGFSKLTWQGFFEPEFAQQGMITAFPFDTLQGSLRYGSNVATTILPGDTNADGQVDHRDLLNIGLIHGSSGPERPSANTTFSAQLAARWNQNLPGDLDYAHADTDGNGVIEEADLALVNDYYEQAAPGGTYTPAPDVSDNNGPAFVVDSPVAVDAGQASELSISLGAGDADAVGYALAFALEFDPEQVDVEDLALAFTDAYLGNELLSLQKVSAVNSGRIEIALSRKDQLNTTTPGGEVVRVNYTPLARNDNESYTLTLQVIPNAFLRSDGSSAPIQGTTAEIMVMGTVGLTEPAWGQEVQVYPNPYTTGLLTLGGPLPRIHLVQVFDLNGRLLQYYAGAVRQLDLTDLATGTYLLKLVADDGQVTRQVVKQ